MNHSHPEVLLAVVDGASQARRGGEHDFSYLAAGLVFVEFVFGLEEAVGAEFVVVEESPQEAHDLCVVLFLHGDEQDGAFDDAEILR